ncbi:MAG: hypothetical protein GKR94_13500 [Gammaproteobacteria bacterium]|nr:hypothetical protein [Gammaproteobacteria bacterium]
MNECLADIPIADAHHHLRDLSHDYPWLSHGANRAFFLSDYSPLLRNYLPDDYRRDAQKHNRAVPPEKERWLMARRPNGIAVGVIHAPNYVFWFRIPGYRFFK